MSKNQTVPYGEYPIVLDKTTTLNRARFSHIGDLRITPRGIFGAPDSDWRGDGFPYSVTTAGGDKELQRATLTQTSGKSLVLTLIRIEYVGKPITYNALYSWMQTGPATPMPVMLYEGLLPALEYVVTQGRR